MGRGERRDGGVASWEGDVTQPGAARGPDSHTGRRECRPARVEIRRQFLRRRCRRRRPLEPKARSASQGRLLKERTRRRWRRHGPGTGPIRGSNVQKATRTKRLGQDDSDKATRPGGPADATQPGRRSGGRWRSPPGSRRPETSCAHSCKRLLGSVHRNLWRSPPGSRRPRTRTGLGINNGFACPRGVWDRTRTHVRALPMPLSGRAASPPCAWAASEGDKWRLCRLGFSCLGGREGGGG